MAVAKTTRIAGSTSAYFRTESRIYNYKKLLGGYEAVSLKRLKPLGLLRQRLSERYRLPVNPALTANKAG
jgi:hypothetical protein